MLRDSGGRGHHWHGFSANAAAVKELLQLCCGKSADFSPDEGLLAE
jgi:hypothetical protein